MTNLITPRALFSPTYLLNLVNLSAISAIRSADLENPTVEPKWIGGPLVEIWPFEIFQNVRLVGRSVVNIYFFLH